MQEFFVGNFRVDILRNQIIHEGDVIALEPKVLEVLKVLAQKSGQVVSHQELLDEVWPDMVVAPNALQRCIGQLRKALNDDGKKQAVIQTHPKRGYSLTAKVTLRTPHSPEVNTRPKSEIQTNNAVITLNKKFASSYRHIITGLVLILVIVYFFLPPFEETLDTSKLSNFTELKPITATDTSEFYSVFSPNGRYIAFSRHATGNLGHFWLKDVETNQEIQITKQAGFYGQPSWSDDGHKLAFTNRGDCTSNCNTTRCMDIQTLYIPLALTEPQDTKTLKTCLNIPHQGLQWVGTTELAYLVNSDDKSRLIVFDIENGNENTLYETHDRFPYSISFSNQSKQLALMQENQLMQQELVLVNTITGEAVSKKFLPPSKYNSWVRWYPVWDNMGKALLYSAGNQLYISDLEGHTYSRVIPTFLDISRPMFAPNGKQIAMTLGKVDRDISEVSYSGNDKNGVTNELNELNELNEHTIARSILRESDAQFQPNGDGIAFFSERSGSRQLWLSQNGRIEQISHVPNNSYISYFVWSPNGKQLAALTNEQLVLFDRKGLIQKIELNFKVAKLFQWTSDNKILMRVIDDSGINLALYDLGSSSLTIVYEGDIRWAQIHREKVIVTDRKNQLKQVENSELIPFKSLSIDSTKTRFFIRGEHLYVMSIDGTFWQHNLDTQQNKALFNYPIRSAKLSDVSPTAKALLVSKHISSKKEIVLLSNPEDE